MTELMAINAVLSGIKTATDIARWLRESDLSLEKAEAKLKLAELMSALAAVKMSTAEARMMLEEKDARIATLLSSLELKAKLVRHNASYYETDDGGGPVGDPYCSRCWEVDRKAVHLHQHALDRSMSTCPACKNMFNWQPKI